MHATRRESRRPYIFAAAMLSLVAAGCQEHGVTAPPPGTSTSTAPAPAPAMPMPPASDVNPTTNPMPVPGKGTDVVQDKGTATGMPGGEAGTVASSGKPGSGTDAGAGTGPAVSSAGRIENKK